MNAWSVEIDRAQSHGPGLPDFLGGGRPACSLGLSHRSSASNRGRLAATLDWLSGRAGDLVVVEGAYLSRWNRMAFDGVSEAEASGAAAEEASAARRRIQRALEERRELPARLLDWTDLASAPEVRATALALERHAAADPAFDRAIRREIADYVTRTRPADAGSLSGEAKSFLRRYVVEEVAVLLDLQRRGYAIEIYHGPDLPLVEAIAERRFSGAPFSCAARTHVSLRLVRAVGGEGEAVPASTRADLGASSGR